MKSTKDIMDHQKKVMPQNKVEKLEANIEKRYKIKI